MIALPVTHPEGRKRESWLPPSLSFLSGLPEAARKRRLLMPVQAFVDDSGGKGHGRHFVLAGLVGNSENWADFSDEWRVCLADPPVIRRFKMREAAGRNGEFNGWTTAARDSKLRSLARIINRHAKFSTYSVIDLNAHAETWGLTSKKPHNDPYFFPFHTTIMATCFSLWDAGWRERFEIIFDEQVIFGPRVKLWYPAVRAALKIRQPEEYTILPVDPIFRTDDEFLPIQAADLFAWCIRREADNSNSFNWLLGDLRDIKHSEYSQYYDRDRMIAVTNESRRLRDGQIPKELFAEYQKIVGML